MKTFLLLIFFTSAVIPQNNNNEKLTPIEIGFSAQLFDDVDIRDAEAAIHIWGNEFFGKLGINYFPTTKIFQDDEEIIRALNENKLDFISLPTTDYFNIMKKTAIEPYFMALGDANTGINYILVARKDKNISSIRDLKNSQIILHSGSFEKLVKMWLETILNEHKEKSTNFFSEVTVADKPSQALLPVFFKQKDACIVLEPSYNSMLELNPQLKNELMIIEKSPEFVGGIMCINKNVSEDIKKIALDTAKKLSKTTSGKQILALFKAKKLVKYNPEYLKKTKELYDKYNKIKK
ncbi:MAG: PhnD/SsuA/transferrin family substrate-binding protein [Ignavibacteriae bacterium]|nr:PhnD/SsuA/transferrin family substrate-binding protein [Ignavibacteriota bacterium]